jgi:hypothetical protein
MAGFYRRLGAIVAVFLMYANIYIRHLLLCQTFWRGSDVRPRTSDVVGKRGGHGIMNGFPTVLRVLSRHGIMNGFPTIPFLHEMIIYKTRNTVGKPFIIPCSDLIPCPGLSFSCLDKFPNRVMDRAKAKPDGSWVGEQ